jgi:hypothetical protein
LNFINNLKINAVLPKSQLVFVRRNISSKPMTGISPGHDCDRGFVMSPRPSRSCRMDCRVTPFPKSAVADFGLQRADSG